MNQRDIINSFKDAVYFHFDFTPNISMKDRSLISKLVKEFGIEKTNKLVLATVENWKKVKAAKKGVKGVPNIGFIYGFRYLLIDLFKESDDDGNYAGDVTDAESYFNS